MSMAELLPARIAQAVARITLGRHNDLARLDAQQRALLAHIVSCADKADFSRPITIARDTLAQRLGCSRATVQRLLASLVAAGLVMTRQVKSRRLGFQVGSITLTQRLVDILSAGEPQRVSAVQHAYQECPSKSSSKSKPAGFFSIPASLQHLAKRLSPAAICKLMALARRAGLRLQDVCAVAADGLAAAREPFAYLRKLIFSGRDFAYIAQQRQEERQQQQREEQRRQACEQQRSRLLQYEGRYLRDVRSNLLLLISGNAALVFEGNRPERTRGAMPLNDANIERLLAGLSCGEVVVC